MLKKIMFGGVGLALLATPLLTSALTVQEQIVALMTQITQLQQQITALSASVSNTTSGSNSSTTLAPGPGTPGYNKLACNAVNRRLWRGLNGTDVMALQDFLIQEGLLPTGSVSGYFGVQTESAVQLWQSSHGIVSSGDPETTGWGVVGPQTLMAMRQSDSDCGGTSGGSTGNTATSPSATVDQHSAMPPNAPFTISGSAWNTNSVVVALAPQNYQGSTDFNTVSNYMKDGGTYSVVGATAGVSSNRWSAAFGGMPTGAYNLFVYDFATHVALITSGSVFVGASTTGTAPAVRGSVSGNTMNIGYANLPSNSYVQLINNQSGNAQASGTFEVSNISGSGEIANQSISDIPAGTYFLRVKQYGVGVDPVIVESSSFTVGGTTTASGSTPSASLSQSADTTVPGGAYTVSWSSKNATSCKVTYTGPDGGATISSGPTSGSQMFVTTLAGTYTGTNTCTGPGGTAVSPPLVHTVTADGTPSSSVSITGSGSVVSGVGIVTVVYANLPGNTYIQLINQQSGNTQSTLVPLASGTGSTAVNAVPSGTYILRVKQYAVGSDPTVVESSPFTVGSTTGTTGTTDTTGTTGTTDSAAPNSSPIVNTTAATNITSTSVTLNGSVNSRGTTGTTGWFRAHTSSPGTCNDTFGTRSSASSDVSFSPGYLTTPFSLAVTGLTPGATYYYCAIAQNPFGKTYGSVISFTAPSSGTTNTATPNSQPIVYTDAPSNITSTSVTLNGRVNSAGTSGTTGWFRAHTSSPGTCNDTFGTRFSSASDASFSPQYQNVPFSLVVSGVVPGTTYYYCAIAQNAFGKSYGSVVSFSAPISSADSLSQIANALTAIQAQLDKLR